MKIFWLNYLLIQECTKVLENILLLEINEKKNIMTKPMKTMAKVSCKWENFDWFLSIWIFHLLSEDQLQNHL
jgi:hypothetical protein